MFLLRRRNARPLRAGLTVIALVSMLAACGEAEEPAIEKTSEAAAKPQPQPVPITGGSQIPDGPLIHVHAPGPDGKMLPISGFPYTGLNADHTTIGNFDGFSAVAYVAGEATGSDGKKYAMETDVRAFKGTYKDAAGMDRTGVFAFV